MKKLIVLAAMLAGTAHAQFVDGNSLLERMRDESPVKRMVALGYVLGVLDSFLGSDICPPDNVQAGQASAVVKQWLEINPDKRHLTASAIVFVSLRNAWPCKQELKPGGKS
jgi:MFS-type transporter involved in bile tolerance (Atg22 family)